MSNLLERLHASFFFYIMLDPGHFLKIGMYSPIAVLIGSAVLFEGLGSWVAAGWVKLPPSQDSDKSPSKQWSKRPRNVVPVIKMVFCAFSLGAILFSTIRTPTVVNNASASLFIVWPNPSNNM
jgi:GPI-anchor transamidase subunit GAA1